MLVDSHCHLDFPEIADQLDAVFQLMRKNQVERALCVSVTPRIFRACAGWLKRIRYPRFGRRAPDYEKSMPCASRNFWRSRTIPELSLSANWADTPSHGRLEWQRERFAAYPQRANAQTAVIHTRAAAETHWDQRMRVPTSRRRHALLPESRRCQGSDGPGVLYFVFGNSPVKNAKDIKAVATAVPL